MTLSTDEKGIHAAWTPSAGSSRRLEPPADPEKGPRGSWGCALASRAVFTQPPALFTRRARAGKGERGPEGGAPGLRARVSKHDQANFPDRRRAPSPGGNP